MSRELTPEAFVESCRRCRPTKHLHGWGAAEIGEMVATLRAELARVAEERDRLRAHLEVAIDLAEEGWGYASEYFCQKWSFDERVLALRTVAGVGADESLPTDEAARILSLETNAETMRASDEGKRDDE
jgi:hypothetical protein